jgi:hypothetical protein
VHDEKAQTTPNQNIAEKSLIFVALSGGRSRTLTCDPLIKRLLDIEISQAVSCKMAQMSSFEINGL